MSSFVRNLQRKRKRFTTNDEGQVVRAEPRPQTVFTKPPATKDGKPIKNVALRRAFGRALGDNGYVTIAETGGPRRVSSKRLAAQGKLAKVEVPRAMKTEERSIERAFKRFTARSQAEQRLDAQRATPVVAITRQMRRFAKRTGEALPLMIGGEAANA